MSAIAVIAEKPSVGRDIARVIGATNRQDGYYSGNGYMVTWAFGHLVALGLPADYGHERLSREALPFIPGQFMLTPKKNKVSGGYAVDPGVSKQLKIIKDVFDQCDGIVVATDAGREGELIFRLIYYFLGCQKPFHRLWISSLTDSAIRKGFQNLRPGQEFDTLCTAATLRAKADWLVGINASKALGIITGVYNNSLGRVQTPTLAMVCRRYKENKQFVVSDYWQLKIGIENNGVSGHFLNGEKFTDKVSAEKVYERIKQEDYLTITAIESKESQEKPPLLYDLTSLQKDANKYHDLSADQTLRLAQKLYEKKLISYPRTGSRFIPDDVFAEIPMLLKKLSAVDGYGELCRPIRGKSLNKGSVNATKVTDHHALITTGIVPVALSKEEKIIYRLIAARMIEAFMPECRKMITTADAACGDLLFHSKVITIVEEGWRKILARKEDKEEEERGAVNPLQGLEPGAQVLINATTLVTRKTSPPAIFTEATLLGAMETAGKELEDKNQRERLKQIGIGTPATRAAIIETLYSRQYIEKKGKSLVPTEKGLFVYESVKGMKIADVALTGTWEQGLYEIENGSGEHDAFLKAIEIFTMQVTSEILSLQIELPEVKTYPCPKCEKGNVSIRQKVAKCDDPDCGFILFREFLGKHLTTDQVERLLSKKKTPVIKGLKGRKGNPFDARLYLNDVCTVELEFCNKKPSSGNKR